MRIFDKEEIDPPSVAGFFWHGVTNSFVPRTKLKGIRWEVRGLISCRSRVSRPLVYYRADPISNKQITSRPVIHRLVAEMTSAAFQQFPRNHAEYHFLPKDGQWDGHTAKNITHTCTYVTIIMTMTTMMMIIILEKIQDSTLRVSVAWLQG